MMTPLATRPVRGASMEPLPEERSDFRPPRATGHWCRCLNGAAPGGAERRVDRALHLAVDVVASMEPLPEERSDTHLKAVLPEHVDVPQWSRYRRSGATSVHELAPGVRVLASMEPLPEERSDANTDPRGNGQLFCLNGAAPGGAERRTQGNRQRNHGAEGLNGAAPGGAERREASAWPSACALPRLNGAAPGGAERRRGLTKVPLPTTPPQWSRSRRSGATLAGHAATALFHVASMEPLPEERSDMGAKAGAEFRQRPQWSRSRRSGATVRRPHQRRARGPASMEPLPEERSDADTPDVAIKAPDGLNGAAPGGAERRHNGAAGGNRQWTASMEPLPEERSDDWEHKAPTVVYQPPQWSRSRRSGATVVFGLPSSAARTPQWSRSRRSGATRARTSSSTRTARLNGAAPGGAERRKRSRTARRKRPGLNGAAPGGAERHRGRGQGRPPGRDASMEPLRRSGATPRSRMACPGQPRLNGAAPGGAERRNQPEEGT